MESDEFGDWLIGEISLAGAQAKSAIFDKALPASLRLESLGVSKKVLLEFLLLQQAMLNTASAARGG